MLTNTFMLHSWNALVVIVINLGNRRRCRICLPEFGSALLCTYLKSTVWWKQKLKSCSSLLSSPLVLWSNSSRSSWFYLFILVFILGIVDVVLVCCQKLPQLLQMLVAEMRTEKKRLPTTVIVTDKILQIICNFWLFFVKLVQIRVIWSR